MGVTQLAGVGRLPIETDEFVGRAAELRQIDELLRDAHLITLVGPGGVGKTRVALRAATAAARRYAEGACLVKLSALSDPALLPHTVAGQLELAELTGDDARDALVAQLRDRRLLLILDTCEHLIDACAQLAEAILAGAPGVTILATSREPLDVVGETTYPIPPLPVPAPGTESATGTGTGHQPSSRSAIQDLGTRGPAARDTAGRDPASRDTAIQSPAAQGPAAQGPAPQGTAIQSPAARDTTGRDPAIQDTAIQDTAVQSPAGRDAAGRDTAAGDTARDLAAAGLPAEGAGRHRRVAPPEDDGGAVELFARRAAAAVPGFVVDDSNRAAVIRLCRGLDGIPLTIELAAGRLRQLSLAEINQRLDRRLTLLIGGADPDGRHATARNAVSWSYDTCTAAERALWARLSVFPDSFDVPSAAEVCASGELSDVEIFETIIRLVDKSLLVHAPAGPDDDGRPRFRMLDTIREFGAEQLAASGNLGGIRDRFIARYLSLARHVDTHVFDDNQLELFATLRREHANIRAALKYALDDEVGRRARERDGGELANRLWAYWLASGLMVEGNYWLTKALELNSQPGASRAWLLVARCFLGAIHGQIPAAIEDGRAAAKLGGTLKQPVLTGRAHAALCLALTFGGEFSEAAQAGKTAERMLTQAGDHTGLIVLDAHLAALYHATGEAEKGIGYYQRGIARFGPRSAERLYHGYLHIAGGMAYLLLPGKAAESTRAFSLALTAKYSLDEVTGSAFALEILGWLAAGAGRWQRAAWLLGAADTQWVRCGARLSNAAVWEEQHQRAEAAAEAALGGDAYAELFTAGARHPLDQVVALAINDAESLSDRVPVVARPGVRTLTDREQEVAYLAAAGLSAEQIARQLFLPTPEVTESLSSVFAKLGVSSAGQLAPWLGGIAGPAANAAPELPQGRAGTR